LCLAARTHATFFLVMAGLDPAIHGSWVRAFRPLDHRVARRLAGATRRGAAAR
jgi:hypothetical protein